MRINAVVYSVVCMINQCHCTLLNTAVVTLLLVLSYAVDNVDW
jgi:hypothetical protein